MKVSSVIALMVLLGSMMVSRAFGQNAANQVSTSDLSLVGTATITAAAGTSRLSGESHKRPDHDVALPAVRSSSRGLKLPSVAGSTAVDRVSALGFAGLTHLDQWNAGPTQFSKEPPDQGLAVGNGFVLEAVNTALAVYDLRGKLLAGPTALNDFFKLPPEGTTDAKGVGNFLTDPECYFDQQTQRWFITIAEIDFDVNFVFGPRARVLIAVSKNKDPRGDFNIFSIDATDDGTKATQAHPGCPCFADQPHVGADTNGFYVSTNEFSIALLNGSSAPFNGAQIYAMSKKVLLNGDKQSAVVHLVPDLRPPDIAYSIQPAKPLRMQQDANANSDDGSGGVEYFLSTLDITSPLDNRIAVWAISNTASLSNSKPDVSFTKVIITSEVYGPPPSAEQKLGPTPLRDFLATPQAADEFCVQMSEPLEKLHTNNDRVQQVVFAGGKLWAGLNTVVEQSGKQRAGIAFFSVTPSMSGGVLKAPVAAQGYLSVSGNDVLNPALAVDGSGTPVIGFTLAGPDFFPSAAFVKITGEKQSSKVHVVAPGVAPEDGFTGYNSCTPGAGGIARWGDYSAATTDDNGNVWFATEFIPAVPASSPRIEGNGTFLAHWGTFVARIPGSDDSQ